MYNMTPYCKNVRNSSSFVSFQDHFWGIRGCKMCHPSQQYFDLHHDHYHHHQDRLPRNCMNILYTSHNNYRTKIAGTIRNFQMKKVQNHRIIPIWLGIGLAVLYENLVLETYIRMEQKHFVRNSILESYIQNLFSVFLMRTIRELGLRVDKLEQFDKLSIASRLVYNKNSLQTQGMFCIDFQGLPL